MAPNHEVQSGSRLCKFPSTWNLPRIKNIAGVLATNADIRLLSVMCFGCKYGRFKTPRQNRLTKTHEMGRVKMDNRRSVALSSKSLLSAPGGHLFYVTLSWRNLWKSIYISEIVFTETIPLQGKHLPN